MEEGDHEDQGGVEQHGEIPEGTTGEGDRGAVSSLDAGRAESWTAVCLKITLRDLLQACFVPGALLLLLHGLQTSFLAYSCPLAFPILGETRSLFFSLPQLLICQSFLLVSLWWLHLPSPGSVLTCRSCHPSASILLARCLL